MVRSALFGFVAISSAFVSGCGMGQDESEKSSKPTAKKAAGESVPQVIAEMPGTPMAERVAVVGLLNKRNGNTRDIELKPGQALRIGNELVIRVRACERTQPWETHPDIGVFLQLIVNERDMTEQKDQWSWAFSGWLFKENPAKNVVQHPIYDVWVKDCRMIFPGEDKPPVALGLKGAEDDDEEQAASATQGPPTPSNRPSSAPQAAPAPRVEPRAEPSEDTEPEPEPDAAAPDDPEAE